LSERLQHATLKLFIFLKKKAAPPISFLVSELVCAIGLGVAGLLSAQTEEHSSWGFKTYSLTGVNKIYRLYTDLYSI
jgi:hypothetical protein